MTSCRYPITTTILGDRWPPYEIRAEMLAEAIEVVRRLWTEESVTHRGKHYIVEDARVFDRPDKPVLPPGGSGSGRVRRLLEVEPARRSVELATQVRVAAFQAATRRVRPEQSHTSS